MSKNNQNKNNNTNKGNKNGNWNRNKGNKSGNSKPQQPRKDSSSPRVNFDNARVDKVADELAKDATKPNANHISDFNRNPELLKAASSYPFGSILGMTLANTGLAVPGIMSILWNPAFGPLSEPEAWTKAAEQIYSYIVHANSRNYKYGFTDLAMIIHAGIELFAAIADAIRVYGVVKYYPEQNYYLADGLIQALGFNPKDIRANLSTMWFDINNIIMRTRQIWIPNVMPLLQRWIRMNSNVYTDAAGDRSQIYAYVRNRYFKYSETASTQGTCLVPATIPAVVNPVTGEASSWTEFRRDNGNAGITRYNWNQFKFMINDMIDALILSEDRGMIYGDILKAYGDGKIYAMPEISVDYTVKPEFNEQVLAQIENLSVCSYNYPRFFTQNNGATGSDLKLYQVWVSADHNTTSLSALQMMPDEQILNFHTASQPSNEVIVTSTRLKVGMATFQNVMQSPKAQFSTTTGVWTSVETEEEGAWVPTTCGTEIPCALYIQQRQLSGYASIPVKTIFSGGSSLSTVQNAYTPLRLMAFDWHPFMYDIRDAHNIGTAEEVGDIASVFGEAFGDFDNYITINTSGLDRLNQVCLYSEFGVPHV